MKAHRIHNIKYFLEKFLRISYHPFWKPISSIRYQTRICNFLECIRTANRRSTKLRKAHIFTSNRSGVTDTVLRAITRCFEKFSKTLVSASLIFSYQNLGFRSCWVEWECFLFFLNIISLQKDSYMVGNNNIPGGTGIISNREPNEFYTKWKRVKNGIYECNESDSWLWNYWKVSNYMWKRGHILWFPFFMYVYSPKITADS